jgi:hypothetical protein
MAAKKNSNEYATKSILIKYQHNIIDCQYTAGLIIIP